MRSGYSTRTVFSSQSQAEDMYPPRTRGLLFFHTSPPTASPSFSHPQWLHSQGCAAAAQGLRAGVPGQTASAFVGGGGGGLGVDLVRSNLSLAQQMAGATAAGTVSSAAFPSPSASASIAPSTAARLSPSLAVRPTPAALPAARGTLSPIATAAANPSASTTVGVGERAGGGGGGGGIAAPTMMSRHSLPALGSVSMEWDAGAAGAAAPAAEAGSSTAGLSAGGGGGGGARSMAGAVFFSSGVRMQSGSNDIKLVNSCPSLAELARNAGPDERRSRRREKEQNTEISSVISPPPPPPDRTDFYFYTRYSDSKGRASVLCDTEKGRRDLRWDERSPREIFFENATPGVCVAHNLLR